MNLKLLKSVATLLTLLGTSWVNREAFAGASSFNLSAPRLSPKGNLAFDAQGPVNETGIFEISPNLIDWAAMGSFSLYNGKSTLYLQPLSETLFCRIRAAEPNEVPHPAAFTASINTDFHKTAFLTEAGLFFKVTDDNNFTYELTISPEPLIDPDDFVLDVVNDTSGLPSDGLKYLGGIRLSPGDLSFFGEAKVVITAPPGTDLSGIVALAWEQDGVELHPVPRSIDGFQVTIPLQHTGGFGIARIVGTNTASVLKAMPTESSQQVEYLVARDQLQSSLSAGSPQAASIERARIHAATPAPCDSLQIQDTIIRILVPPRLRAALASDATLENGLSTYRNATAMVSDFDSKLSEPCNAATASLIAEVDDLALQALDSSIERAAVHCSQRDLRALVRLYRDIELTKVGHWSSKLSPSRKAHYKELFIQYAKFKLELLSSTSYTTAAGTVRSSVSANFPMQALENGDDFIIQATGAFGMDSEAWDNVVSPCIASAAPAPGLLAVNHLYLRQTDIDINKIVTTDDDIRRPTYGLLYDPYAATPGENYKLTCDGRSIGLFPSFWGAIYGGFHKNEIKKMPDGRQALYVKDFHYDSDRTPSKKEYQNIGIVAGGDSSETTDITIEFLGGN
jgi:hypothetical protein